MFSVKSCRASGRNEPDGHNCGDTCLRPACLVHPGCQASLSSPIFLLRLWSPLGSLAFVISFWLPVKNMKKSVNAIVLGMYALFSAVCLLASNPLIFELSL